VSKVTVFGSYIMDLTCMAPHIPVVNETVLSGPFVIGPGGKGFNQAVAALMCGVDVSFVTKIGTDLFNTFVHEAFDRFGLAEDYLFETSEAATGAALIVVENETGNNAIAVAPGACELLTLDDVEGASGAFDGATVFLTQLESNIEATHRAIERAHEVGASVILNPAPYQPVTDEFLEHVDILLPNEVECAYMTGIEVVDDGSARAAAEELSKSASTVIITLGDRGVFCPQISDEVIPAMNVDTIDTTGAGDAFAGIFAAYLAQGSDIEEAVRLAMAGAALSTTKFGTSPSMPTKAQIEEAANSFGM
jgi:ribokinase